MGAEGKADEAAEQAERGSRAKVQAEGVRQGEGRMEEGKTDQAMTVAEVKAQEATETEAEAETAQETPEDRTEVEQKVAEKEGRAEVALTAAKKEETKGEASPEMGVCVAVRARV